MFIEPKFVHNTVSLSYPISLFYLQYLFLVFCELCFHFFYFSQKFCSCFSSNSSFDKNSFNSFLLPIKDSFILANLFLLSTCSFSIEIFYRCCFLLPIVQKELAIFDTHFSFSPFFFRDESIIDQLIKHISSL
nr:MAG TPA: hypothetical protein [Caudoviricetes sp.]